MKYTTHMVMLLAIALASCGNNTRQMEALKKENDSLRQFIAKASPAVALKNRKFKNLTRPDKWSAYKPWVERFQTYYGNNYSSFLVKKSELNKFFIDGIEYVQILWAKNPGSPYEETLLVRGVKEDGTIAYLDAHNNVIYGDSPEDIEYVLEHTLPCPPCITETGSAVEYDY